MHSILGFVNKCSEGEKKFSKLGCIVPILLFEVDHESWWLYTEGHTVNKEWTLEGPLVLQIKIQDSKYGHCK